MTRSCQSLSFKTIHTPTTYTNWSAQDVNLKQGKERVLSIHQIGFYKGITDLESSKSSNKSITKEKKITKKRSIKKCFLLVLVRRRVRRIRRHPNNRRKKADNGEEDDYNNNNSFINNEDKEIKDPLNPKPKGKKEVSHSKSKGKMPAKGNLSLTVIAVIIILERAVLVRRGRRRELLAFSLREKV
ncbi:hypothetical protein ASPWEDRAFT_32345 [Aspergillus wentii DTO 134E9]|uniref:Uncharacterized protein n=1 Tax=Aspergillus wentii DTO 134E9 TaxID=1073089 RepID=A0A1L9R5E0_ASPWE|nr:uncharacterized protein ASPWEDRAFT_32345 [Aspergillus wentii DTO 134E9]OJJ30129.1 hypothetical protein ASPWEDRAFT_32345 [Aspergillus wentii DTO 134E9]